MNLFNLRKTLKDEFIKNDIDAEDVDFICSEVLNIKRTELCLVDEISSEQENEIQQACKKRLQNLPVEKIFNKAYFYGLEFLVDNNVLSPRPETEILVETALKYIKENEYNSVLDLCTGSGCIAVSIKKNADVKVMASDVSAKALKIAKQNAIKHNVEINFIRSDMFEKIEDKFDLIVSNPPYIDTDEIETLDKEVHCYDPMVALDGGDFGLKFYNIIHNEAKKHLNLNGMLIMEIGDDQKDLIMSLFNDFQCIEIKKDIEGHDRIMVFKR